jgi:hypothetical protein
MELFLLGASFKVAAGGPEPARLDLGKHAPFAGCLLHIAHSLVVNAPTDGGFAKDIYAEALEARITPVSDRSFN